MRYVQTWSGDGAPASAGGAPEGVERQCPILWNKWEYQAGKYDFAAVDRMLAARADPCHLVIVISMYGKATSLVDYTPAFHKKSLRATASNGKVGEIPNYSDATWRAAYGRAIEAMAQRYRENPQVAGFQIALGLDNETQATCLMSDGTDFNKPFSALLSDQGYYDFINETVRRSVTAWGGATGKPVYVPGAPAPGTTWGGSKRRDVVIQALADGGRYLMCGLRTDNDNATGLGGHQGKGLTDIIPNGPSCAFEGGKEAGDVALELYWMLMRALHWNADFVQLQRSWYEKGHWRTVKDLLPAPDARWIVFRDSEWPAPMFTGADGRKYGFTGEVGPWGRGPGGRPGLCWVSGGTLVKDLARLDLGRHWLKTAQGDLVTLDGGADPLPDGLYDAQVVDCTGMICQTQVTAAGGCVTLPGGTGYHRVELRPAKVPPIEVRSLEDDLRAAALAHETIAVNPDAALCKAGRARGLWATSNEFVIDFDGASYVAQRFRDPASTRAVVLFCAAGEWDRIKETAG